MIETQRREEHHEGIQPDERRDFARRLGNLHEELERTFGDARAWEFILSFYEGAARDDK